MEEFVVTVEFEVSAGTPAEAEARANEVLGQILGAGEGALSFREIVGVESETLAPPAGLGA